jgi:hypothetical protein
MPLLELDEIPSQIDLQKEVLSEINEIYDALREISRQPITLPDENGFKVSNMVRDHFRATLNRILDLLETMTVLHRESRELPVFLIGRAVLETIATLDHYCEKIEVLLDQAEEEEVAQKVHDITIKYTFGAKKVSLKDPGIATRRRFLRYAPETGRSAAGDFRAYPWYQRPQRVGCSTKATQSVCRCYEVLYRHRQRRWPRSNSKSNGRRVKPQPSKNRSVKAFQ